MSIDKQLNCLRSKRSYYRSKYNINRNLCCDIKIRHLDVEIKQLENKLNYVKEVELLKCNKSLFSQSEYDNAFNSLKSKYGIIND